MVPQRMKSSLTLARKSTKFHDFTRHNQRKNIFDYFSMKFLCASFFSSFLLLASSKCCCKMFTKLSQGLRNVYVVLVVCISLKFFGLFENYVTLNVFCDILGSYWRRWMNKFGQLDSFKYWNKKYSCKAIPIIISSQSQSNLNSIPNKNR